MASNGAVAVEDALFLQARAVHGKDFEDWVGVVQNALQLNDRGPNCLTLLRQLYVLTAVTKYTRNLSPAVFSLLRSLVLEPEQGPPRVRLVASGILRELAPSIAIVVRDFNPPVEECNIPYILPVLLAQTNAREKLTQLAPQIVKWLTQPGYDEELTRGALSFLHALCSHSRALERVSEDQFRSLSSQLSSWLRHASRSCLSAPSSISIFSGGSRRQLVPVKEIDGSSSQDIFTILNIGGFYSSDQLLNIHAFSFLRRWLLTTLSTGNAPPSPSPAPTPTLDSRGQVSPSPVQERRSSSRSSLTPSFTSSLPSPLPIALSHALTSSLTASLMAPGRSRHSFKDSIFQYCLRVIDQCERKPTRSTDEDLAMACLYESISILDILCSLSRSLIHGVLPTMRKLYTRFAQDPITTARLLLALVKFFINHGESEMYDSETPIDSFFREVLSTKFNDPGLAYDVIEYLIENLEVLHGHTNIFTKYFPNILKILAWSPVTFVAEFLQLLPAFISKSTAAEVLHSLLDLPCLSATLQAQHLINAVPNLTDWNLLPQYAKCLAAFQDPAHKLMFGHFLRSEIGKGDTIDRLSTLHHLLADFSHHQRVIAATEITPLLLRLFFKTVFHGGDGVVVSQLAMVLLERITVLFDSPSFQLETRKVIAEQLLLTFRAYPNLLVDHHRDIMEFLGNLRNLNSGGEHCYLHLVWVVGEYSHSGYDSRCTTTMLMQFFETLESVAYEVALNLGQQEDYTTRLVLVLMSTVAKLASRCQDLIPRALLCLNKIVQLSSEEGVVDPPTHRVLLGRANELVNVLKIPSIASTVLSPSPHSSERAELDRQTTMALLLQTTANHLQA